MPIPDDYLGDGVYVHDEPDGVSLDTRAQDAIGRMKCPGCDGSGKHHHIPNDMCERCCGDGHVTVNRIMLQAAVCEALKRYLDRVAAAAAAAAKEGT